MSTKMLKYPKIGQFRDAAYEIKRRASFQGLDEQGEPIMRTPATLPTLRFHGTVKLHGTNASVVIQSNGDTHYQSRSRIITPADDNAGFASWAETVDWSGLADVIAAATELDAIKEVDESAPMAIYGEWCGGAIQKGVALNELPKMFVVFGIRVGDTWIDLPDDMPRDGDVLFINHYPTFGLLVDFNASESAQNEMVAFTEAVEAECPVGKAYGVSGVGEGIVWRCIDEGYRDIAFKVKGEKHSRSRVRTLSPVDAEAADAKRALAERIMTGERLEQGLEHLAEHGMEPTRKSLGAFLKHVVSDCLIEENLTIREAGFEPKEISKHLSESAKRWFFEQEARAA